MNWNAHLTTHNSLKQEFKISEEYQRVADRRGLANSAFGNRNQWSQYRQSNIFSSEANTPTPNK